MNAVQTTPTIVNHVNDVWRSVSQFQERGPKTPAAFRDNKTEYSVQDEIVNVLQTQQNTPSTSSAILNHRRINTSQMITESDNTLTLLLNIREQNNEILALLREFQIETCSIRT